MRLRVSPRKLVFSSEPQLFCFAFVFVSTFANKFWNRFVFGCGQKRELPPLTLAGRFWYFRYPHCAILFLPLSVRFLAHLTLALSAAASAAQRRQYSATFWLAMSTGCNPPGPSSSTLSFLGVLSCKKNLILVLLCNNSFFKRALCFLCCLQ